MDAPIHDCLSAYRDLVARVDRLLGDVRCRYPADIACHKGCDCGCRNLSIFPIEALSIWLAIRELPAKTATIIRQRAAANTIWDCPLLEDRACGLYPFRPIICRTHGLPLQTIYNGRPSVGYCRRNFKNRPAIPPDAVIDLDWINDSLRAVNAALAPHIPRQMPVRLSIAAAVLLRFR
ncbi:MAG: YkgJ family cysteine cluster protein [Deltaproteobacteria bacterium]|jgi:Fe-S-cluster containining protein|nr:YkgJ family cysteine cluster protein [Deltaproteobacteria bacterium]